MPSDQQLEIATALCKFARSQFPPRQSMANILMATMGFTGHITAGLPIIRKLVERGHRVMWYTGRKFQKTIEAVGAMYAPMNAGKDFDDSNWDEAFPEQVALSGLASMRFFIKGVLIDAIPGHLHDLEVIVRDFQPEVFLVDHLFMAAVPLHARTQVPWATYSVSPLTISSRDTAPDSLGLLPDSSWWGRIRNRSLYFLFDQIVLREVNAHWNQQQAVLGIPSSIRRIFEVTLSPFLYLQPTVEAFEYPRSDLPLQVHFIGPFLPGPSRDFVPPTWWNEVLDRKRPVVHVTQGTLATDAEQLILPTIHALTSEGVLLVVTTGGRPLEILRLDSFPPHVRAEPFIPHYHLLPHVSAMVTNGGYGGVQTALANGVPLVVAGKTEDKAEVANRVMWSGTGINLKTNTPRAEQLRDAVRRILAEPGYREKSKAMQIRMQHRDAANEGAVLIEQLAQSRRPVLRTSRKDGYPPQRLDALNKNP